MALVVTFAASSGFASTSASGLAFAWVSELAVASAAGGFLGSGGLFLWFGLSDLSSVGSLICLGFGCACGGTLLSFALGGCGLGI